MNPQDADAPLRVLVPLHIDDTPPLLGGVLHGLGGDTMGTTWEVRWVGHRGDVAETHRPLIENALNEVIQEMSTWAPDSSLCRFNRRPTGSRQTLEAGFARVMDVALDVARRSGGAFDPTAGRWVDAWGFGPPGPQGPTEDLAPTDGSAASPNRPPDWSRLSWDPTTRQLLQPGQAQLDLSAIAKGHAVDLVFERLRDHCVHSLLVEVGGELRGAGLRPDGHPWWVAVETPGAGAVDTRIALHGLSIATSGDYRRYFFDAQGRRRPHTIDPRTGAPVEHGLASVTVVHAEAVWADAWSTALTVLGWEAGWTLACQENLAALFVQRHDGGRWHERSTPALERMAC